MGDLDQVMKCRCGYDLHGVPFKDGARTCPECGGQVPLFWPKQARVNWLAPFLAGVIFTASLAILSYWAWGTYRNSDVMFLVPIAGLINGLLAGLAVARAGRTARRAVCVGLIVAILMSVIGVVAAGAAAELSRPARGSLFGY